MSPRNEDQVPRRKASQPRASRPAQFMISCHGNGETHCCVIKGKVCDFLEIDTVFGRHWVCGLRRMLGNWDEVHADLGYIENVHSVWEKTGTADCGDWRVEGQCCFGPNNPPIYNQED